MDIKINRLQPTINFTSSKNKFLQTKMLQTIPKLLEQNKSLEQISEITGQSKHSILAWVKDNTGHTFKHFQRKTEHESYRDVLTQYVNEGKNVNEISKLINRGYMWTKICLQELGLYRNKNDKYYLLGNQISELVQQGYTVEKIAKTLNISKNKVINLIEKIYNTNIVRLRHTNNIIINRENNEKTAFKDKLALYLSQDMSVTEISKKTGLQPNRVSYWINKFGFIPKRKENRMLMIEKMVDMIKKGYSLKEIASEIGVSATSVGNWIIKKYGKTYRELNIHNID